MGSINQNHVLGGRESNFRERARSMPPHRGMSSLRESGTQGRSEQCCGGTFLRNNACQTASLGANACHSPNCRHGCQSNINFRTSGHVHDRLPGHDEHAEGAPRIVNRGQASVPFCSVPRGAIQSGCSCGGHRRGPERCEESEVQVLEENRCYHREASTGDVQGARGHSHGVDDCGRCCPRRPNTNLERDGGVYNFEDRLLGTSASPCFSVSEGFTHRVSPNGFKRKPSPMSRKAATIASRTDSTTFANVLVPTQASKEQVIFYGWFLKRPTTIDSSPACSALPQVAIGGYKSAGLLESDYCESGPIVQRLERWRLRTSDGMEVGLMGMINVAKSVENGFPIALAQCFMIGFPSAWIYMISNFCTVASKSCSPDLPSSSASPSETQGQTQDSKDYGRKDPLMTLSLEADPVHIILSSSLFISPEDNRFRSMRRGPSTNNVSTHSGVMSDATSVPQSSNCRGDLEKIRNDSDSCYGAINLGNQSARYEPKAPVSSESPVTGPVLSEGGGEHPASLEHVSPDERNSAVAKEELSKECGTAVLNAHETTRNGEAHPNIDWGEFLGDGNSRSQEEDARIRACEEINFLQEVGVIAEAISKECTCSSNSDLKRICTFCCREVGLEGARCLAGDRQDGESKADVEVKDCSNEVLLSSGGETAKHSALQSKDGSESTRKRPFEELNLEEEVERQRKLTCGTNSSNGVSATCGTGEETRRVLPDSLPAGRHDDAAGLTDDSVPCTPLQESRKRPRSGTETPCIDQEVRDEGLCIDNADEIILDTTGAEQAAEDKILLAFTTAEDMTGAVSRDCKRPKKSAALAGVSSPIHFLDKESVVLGVEVVLDRGANACEDEIVVATRDMLVDETEIQKSNKEVERDAVVGGRSKTFAEKQSEAALQDEAPVDVHNEHSTISPENLNLAASAMRRRRRSAVMSSSKQSGKDSKSAPGKAEAGVGCLGGADKGADEAPVDVHNEQSTISPAKFNLPGSATRRRRRRCAVTSPANQSGKDSKSAPRGAETGVTRLDGAGKGANEAPVDVHNEQSKCSPENLNLPGSSTRRRRRRSAVTPPSKQSGNDSKSAPGGAETGVTRLDGAGKGANEAPVDVHNEQSKCSPENLNLPGSSTRRRRRRSAVTSPSKQSGNDSKSAPGGAETGVGRFDGASKAADDVHNEQITIAPENLNLPGSAARRSRRRPEVTSPKSAPGAGETGVGRLDGAGKGGDEASVDVHNEQSTISPENLNLPGSSTRRRRRRPEVTSPSKQSGKDLSSAPGGAETGGGRLDGAGKAVDEAPEDVHYEQSKISPENLKLPGSATRRRQFRSAVTSPSKQSGKDSSSAPGGAETGVGRLDGACKVADEAPVDVHNEQSTISPENLKLPGSATRRRQFRSAVTSPSKQSGKDSSSASGGAETGVGRLDGAGKGADTASKSDGGLEEVTDAEHLCKSEVKDVLTTSSSKYHRKTKVRYYKGRRRRCTRRSGFGEDVLDPTLNPDLKSTGGGKCSEDENDDRLEKSKEENTEPAQRKQPQRATRKSCETSRRMSHEKPSQTLGDGPGDTRDNDSHRDVEECRSVAKSPKRGRKTEDRCASPASKSPSTRRSTVKASKQGIEESKPRTQKIKPRSSIFPPPPPSPRVVDKTMVPEAFGLKTSRHGRVLVPRLATWLNQSIKYDMDGSIIAISEGFQGAEEELGTGSCSFKPPSDRDAVTMQTKLRKAAEVQGEPQSL